MLERESLRCPQRTGQNGDRKTWRMEEPTVTYSFWHNYHHHQQQQQHHYIIFITITITLYGLSGGQKPPPNLHSSLLAVRLFQATPSKPPISSLLVFCLSCLRFQSLGCLSINQDIHLLFVLCPVHFHFIILIIVMISSTWVSFLIHNALFLSFMLFQALFSTFPFGH